VSPVLPVPPLPPLTEAAARDAALDLLEATRLDLVMLAHDIALRIWHQKGEVTATQVWLELDKLAAQDPGLRCSLDSKDPRWMGAVFRTSRGWVHLRLEISGSGSHKRRNPVWTR
jgi:hypothetical protein